MPRFFDPPGVAAPASRYSHGVEHALAGRRLLISGQVGTRPDGSVPEGLEEQLDAAWRNLLAVVEHAGFSAGDLVKITAYCTVPGAVGAVRAARERWLPGQAPASTYLEVAGLASAAFLVEIEGEAVRE